MGAPSRTTISFSRAKHCRCCFLGGYAESLVHLLRAAVIALCRSTSLPFRAQCTLCHAVQSCLPTRLFTQCTVASPDPRLGMRDCKRHGLHTLLQNLRLSLRSLPRFNRAYHACRPQRTIPPILAQLQRNLSTGALFLVRSHRHVPPGSTCSARTASCHTASRLPPPITAGIVRHHHT